MGTAGVVVGKMVLSLKLGSEDKFSDRSHFNHKSQAIYVLPSQQQSNTI